MHQRAAWDVANGMRLARATGRLSTSWYESLAETAEEAEELAYQENAKRHDQEVRERMRQLYEQPVE